MDNSPIQQIREMFLKASHNEQNPAMFWKLISVPEDPRFYRYTEEKQEELKQIASEFDGLLAHAISEYSDDVKELASASPSPRTGKPFDLVSLLSSFGGRDLVRNNGDRVALNSDTFRGKYVMVCFWYVPEILGCPTNYYEIINLLHELYSMRDDFEMVMVARMNRLADDREVFDHFFSGFPESCFAIPFEDNQRRDYVCKVLDLRNSCLMVNDKGTVLPSLLKWPAKLDNYGAVAFPFERENMHENDGECRELLYGGASLEKILRCNEFSPKFVYKLDSMKEVSISQLSDEVKKKNKHVGLYLCSGGEFLPDLLDVYDKCMERKLEFEIVVVYLPFKARIDQKIFQEKINGLLQKHNVLDWWCLPFNNSVSRRFWRLNYDYDTEYNQGYGPNFDDKMIVVGPNIKYLDVYGACVVKKHGVDAFPFTIDGCIHARTKELQEIKLESLFIDDDVLFFRGNDKNDVISMKDLRGSKVFLCISALQVEENEHNWIEGLVSVYNEMKAMAMEDGYDFEVIFVEVGSTDSEIVGQNRSEIQSRMPWYFCPMNGTNSKQLNELMRLSFSPYNDYLLIGFGEDGRVFSVQSVSLFKYDQKLPPADHSIYNDVRNILGYDSYRMDDFARSSIWRDSDESE